MVGHSPQGHKESSNDLAPKQEQQLVENNASGFHHSARKGGATRGKVVGPLNHKVEENCLLTRNYSLDNDMNKKKNCLNPIAMFVIVLP